ncbi:MAG: hypothetical protein P8Y70_19055, partial [Candidatus Lokiarchaeota archaeon]
MEQKNPLIDNIDNENHIITRSAEISSDLYSLLNIIRKNKFKKGIDQFIKEAQEVQRKLVSPSNKKIDHNYKKNGFWKGAKLSKSEIKSRKENQASSHIKISEECANINITSKVGGRKFQKEKYTNPQEREEYYRQAYLNYHKSIDEKE